MNEPGEAWKRTGYYEQLPAWKRVLLNEPDVFLLRYFPHRIQKLEDFHLRLIGTALNEVRALILYPAGHGKTTITSTLLPILELCRDPDVRIAIIGKNESEAQGIMRVIQAELGDNKELIRDFGPFVPAPDSGKPWALGYLEVAQRTRRAKEATISVFGSGANTVLGYRTDWTICDDVISEKNSATPEQRVKIKDWFDLKAETGPEHAHSRLTVVGTRFDPADMYADLELMTDPDTGDGIWKLQHEDAVADEEARLTLWPERWPWQRLMQQKAKVGTLNFNKRYRNIAVDASRMVFKEAHIRGGYIGKEPYPGCLDRDLKVGDYADNWRRVAGFDPAIGGTRSAKFVAHVTIAQGSCKHHERCYWVIDVDRDQFTLPQQVELILRKHEEYELLRTIVEANSYQQGLLDALKQKMDERGIAFQMDPHFTTRTNKPNPELGVQAMAPWFEQGRVHIPWGDPFSQRRMRQLVEELEQYPGRTTDTVMAFWFAWRSLQESAPKFKSTNYLRKPMQWGTHKGRRVVKNPYYAQPQVIHGADA